MRIIQATNLILQEALTSRTEEQLGQFCLKHAVELTESNCGFIYEITPSGLRDIATYNPMWDECRTIDQKTHLKLSINRKIFGLFGKVIMDEKSLIANDPTHHPARIGIPQGHPPFIFFSGSSLKE